MFVAEAEILARDLVLEGFPLVVSVGNVVDVNVFDVGVSVVYDVTPAVGQVRQTYISAAFALH